MTSLKFIFSQGVLRSCIITILREKKLASFTRPIQNVTDGLLKTAVRDI